MSSTRQVRWVVWWSFRDSEFRFHRHRVWLLEAGRPHVVRTQRAKWTQEGWGGVNLQTGVVTPAHTTENRLARQEAQATFPCSWPLAEAEAEAEAEVEATGQGDWGRQVKGPTHRRWSLNAGQEKSSYRVTWLTLVVCLVNHSKGLPHPRPYSRIKSR